MLDQFDVYVENSLTSDIRVIRQLPDGSQDIDVTIASGDVDRFLLPEPEVLLIISPPSGVKTNTCRFEVTKNADLVSWLAMDDQWTIQSAHDNDIKVPEVAPAVFVIVAPLDA